jgi:hypothetical protein
MAEAPLPTEEAWAREAELYRGKNERRSDTQSGRD